MDDKKWERLVFYMRKPSTILAILALLGLGVNVGVMSLKYLPLLKEKQSVQLKADQADSLMGVQEHRPIPAKILSSDFDALLKQVPIGSDVPDFLRSLKAAEAQSGVILSSLSLGEAGKENTPSSSLSAELQNLMPAGTTSSPVSAASPVPAPTPAQNGQPASNGQTGLNTTAIHVQYSGTYLQVTDFMKRLYQLERIVQIKQWQFAIINDGAATSKPNARTTQPLVQMTMTIEIYNAPQYSGSIRDLPSTESASPSNRQDPTMSNDEFSKLLQSLSTATKP